MEKIEEKSKTSEKLKWIDTPFEYVLSVIILSLFFALMYKHWGIAGILCIGIASIITCLAFIQREIKKKNEH